MEFSLTERIILTNQYLILEKLYPERANEFQKTRRAIERGYESGASGYFDDLVNAMKSKDCAFVKDVLKMFFTLQNSYKNLEDKSGVDPGKLKFPGFDAEADWEDDEWKYLHFVRYLAEERDTYVHLERADPDFDSHEPYIPKYRRMLQELPDKFQLSKEEILRVLEA